MNIVTLLQDLATKDIRLWLEEGQLRFSAPDGAMTPDVISNLKLHKPQIIQFLSQNADAPMPALDIELIPRGGLLDLSSAQERLWFIQQLDPSSDAYHIQGALKLTGELSVSKLSDAIDGISARHEVLRSHFELDGGLPKIAISANTTAQLQQASGSQPDLDLFLNEQLSKPFNLLQGPLFRVGLFTLNNTNAAQPEHILCVCMHHIISDGWSLGVLLKELVAFYAGGKQAEQLLPPLSCQYVDYAAWQQSETYLQQANKEKAFWLEQLTGTPTLDLPFDHHKYDDKLNDGSSYSLVLDAALSQQLNTFAKDNDCTLFMLLLALYHSLLTRLTGQQDFAIGTPVAGRLHCDLENLIGCFVNTQAIRLETDNDTSFESLLQQTKTATGQALSHQSLAFEDIVQHLNIERNIDISPVFQTLFVLQNTPLDATSVDGILVEPLKSPNQNAQFPLALNAQEFDQEIILSFNYQPSRFNATSIERFADYFKTICLSILNNSHQALQSIDLLSPAEKDIWLNTDLGLNATAQSYTSLLDSPEGSNPSVIELFTQCVQQHPDALAVSFEESTLSYAQLDQASNQLAHLIQGKISAGNIIAVSMPRCSELSITLLAILKAGAAYLPLDTELPIERLNFILEDAKPSLLISSHLHSQFNEHCNAFSGEVLSWHSQAQTLEQQLTQYSCLGVTAQAHDLFNIIYTSGSTGTPKGVMVTQAGIHNRLNWMQSQYPINSNDRILQKTPYSFDVSVWELFWPLIAGASLHFAKVDGHKDPSYIAETIQNKNISVLHFVPSMFGEFLQQKALGNLSSLRQIFTSGEALQLSHAQDCADKLAHVQLANLYGPTEAAIDVSYYDCKKDSHEETHNTIPIGKAISNTQLYVLNDALQLQPTGISGELYIGGVNVAAGYVNRPELTAKQFISSPFNAESNYNILYKTGDRARLLADGNIEYLGRNDSQVKLRGLRIELGEIEAKLKQEAAVSDALVKVSNDVLVAYIISNETIDEPRIKQALSTSLPAYMQPQHYLFLDAWPLTPNGKINRKALPHVDIQAKRSIDFTPPSSDTEIALAAIWQQVLKLDSISIHDSFFDLGGHSLTATQVFTLTQEIYPVQLPLREIFDTPTIAAIAASIDTRLIEESVFAGSDNSTEDDDDMESFIL